MSRFLSEIFEKIEPYVPGEQPQDKSYIKLNTNELPYPPSPLAVRMARQAALDMNLYPDPDCRLLRKTAASVYGIKEDQIMFSDGSDDVLNFVMMAYCDEDKGLLVPEVTYSFYRSIAKVHGIDLQTVPLREDLSIDIRDYFEAGRTIMIANPNAPTGIALSIDAIEQILIHNSDDIVVIDEAYVDFGGQSAVSLISKYENLLVVRTFSKVNGMAGGRLGFVMGDEKLIEDLNALRNSCNPYAVSSMTMMAGIGALLDRSYEQECVKRIKATREKTCAGLKKLGFEMTDSSSNFIFVRHKDYDGLKLYQDLKDRGILIRHFETPLLHDYNRISIGTDEDMEAVVSMIGKLLKEKDR